MTKVYPNAPSAESPSTPPSDLTADKEEVMTVWRKSLLFNCQGFTVFDGEGNLRFRVDSYSGGRNDEIVLMDSCGKPLFSIRRKRLSLTETWLIYDKEETVEPLSSVKKHVTLLPSKGLAHVTPCRPRSPHSYSVEGSYAQRSCTVYDGQRNTVAEIRRKEAPKGVALGGDVFRLVVQPGVDLSFNMAMVIVLEQMYGS
ncbi:uncharacterized protein A4U43_C08F32930 [Asparagus officinalis]|uniref:protein LURP-one-related 8-like n=1 Tax=Asparagus officinalis TaxID=4686 RepID=UPI00098E72D1|nr:protein LURP-one-related 8-like [Asparagus officinalis]ONK61725.1 uncharacterized protein A4U43_C08F32930 [Asparagus officinalis]